MGMSQPHVVLMATMNDGGRASLSRFEVANATLLEIVYAAPKGAGTCQLNQQCLINVDQGNIRKATSVLKAYIIGNCRIQDARSL